MGLTPNNETQLSLFNASNPRHQPLMSTIDKLNLSLGAKLDIQEINEFDRSIFVSINDAAPIFISHEVAKNILVKILA